MYKDSDYAFTWKSLTIFCEYLGSISILKMCLTFSRVATIAILLLLLTFVFAIMTMRNFGRGLKDARTFP